jgi:hypothetical protein
MHVRALDAAERGEDEGFENGSNSKHGGRFQSDRGNGFIRPMMGMVCSRLEEQRRG